MKKILLSLMVLLSLGFAASAAVGDQFTAGDIKYQVLNEETKTASVVGYVGLPSEVNIPATANGYSIVRIDYSAFLHCDRLTSVVISESVTEIGANAFDDCSALVSITFPNSVTVIDSNTFRNCSNLPSVDIPNSVTEIRESAFEGCSSLNSVAIPNSVTIIDTYAFSGCSGLTSITIPESVTEMGASVFNCCSSLQSVIIPNSVTIITDWIFAYCSALASVTIPNSVTAIDGCAFYGCINLKNVYCYAVNPPELESNVFYEVEVSDVTLHVVEDAVAAYKGTDVWKEFNIVGDLTAEAGIAGIEADDFGAAEYFNMSGVRVNADTLAPGFYIKRQGGKAEKVLVK